MDDKLLERFLEEDNTAEAFDIKKYLFGILNRWWLILISFLIIGIPWVYYIHKQPPVYKAEVWVSFENMTGSVSRNVLDTRKRRLQSRTFAEEVTAKMGLTLQLLNENGQLVYDRENYFKSFTTTKSPATGIYHIQFHPNGNTAIRRDGVLIDSVKTRAILSDTMTIGGCQFVLNPDIVKQTSRFQFKINPFDVMVQNLVARENVNFNDTGSLMSVAITDKNPYVASQIVNMLADIFIHAIKEMRRETNKFNLTYLEEQLEVARENLDFSDAKLRNFQRTHIRGLDKEAERTVNRQDRIINNIARNEENIDEIENILKKLDPMNPQFGVDYSPRYVYRQLANLPIFDDDQNMGLIKLQLSDLDNAYNELIVEQNRPELNPDVKEVYENISNLENKIYQLAQEKVITLQSEIVTFQKEKKDLDQELARLPEENSRLIRLERERKADEESYQTLLRRYNEAQLSEASAPENVRIIDPAIPSTQPESGDKQKKMLLGLVAGLFFGLGLAFILEFMDKSIRTRDDIKRFLKFPVLGSIPKVKFDEYEFQDSEKTKSVSSQIVTHDYSPTPVGEAYRVLRTNLLFGKKHKTLKSLVIGSVAPGEGKSFTSANLAITLAQQKSKTLLVDADLRRGVLHNTFNIRKKPGLTNYLTGMMPLQDVIMETYVPNLSLITCGSMVPNPSEILGSVRMSKFIEGITNRFDFVIFDTPPLNAATDAVVLGTMVDGVAVIVRSGQTNGVEVQKRLELFENVQTKIIGVVLNASGADVAHEGYSYYKY